MQFSFTDEQIQFREMVHRFLNDKSPTTEVRRLMATDAGFDAAVWQQLATELGLTAIHIPEAYGGAGFGFVELGIVMEELGRSLMCAPYFSTVVLASNAILNAADESQKSRWLPGIAAGETRAALAVVEPDGRWDLSNVATIATPVDDSYQITGTKSFVIDGHTAELIIVAARLSTTNETALFAVADSAVGMERRQLDTMDPTRKQALITLNSAPAELLGSPNNGRGAIEKTLTQASIALANEMVGGSQALLDSAVDYAKLRMQFGRAIGSFQAIKHKCADMLLDVELAKSSAYAAAAAEADNDPESDAFASLAKAGAADAYMRTAAECIQIHGGIGFTWDNDTHLWFKRAKSSEVLLGDPSYHRELLMQRWAV